MARGETEPPASPLGGRLRTDRFWEALGGGLFTNAVADVIARNRQVHDLDGNGSIEASELYVGVKRLVTDRTEGRQVPWFARKEMVGDFSVF